MENEITSPLKSNSINENNISVYPISELIDITDLQQLVDSLFELTECPTGIFDANNTPLVSSRLLKICTCYPTFHTESAINCIESDPIIRQKLETDESNAHKCKCGLRNLQIPIFIEGKIIASIFIGQFIYDDDEINKTYSEQHSETLDFYKTEYLDAFKEVLIIPRKKEETLKKFAISLAMMLTKTCYSNLLLKKEKIEDLRNKKEQLKESEIMFRKVFEQAGVGIVQVEVPSGRFMKINNMFAEMLGYSIDELTQMTFKQITHPEDIEKNLDQMKLLYKGQISEVSTEKRYIRKDGTTLYANLKVSSMREIPDWKKNHIAIIEDISERKKSDESIKESEQRLKTIFEQSPIGLMLLDNDGKFLDCNPVCLTMFGSNTSEVLQDFDFFNAQNFSEQQKKEIKEGKKVRFEMKFDFELVKKSNLFPTDKSGIFYISCFSTSFKIQGNNKTGMLLHLIDITERKTAENLIKEESDRFRATMDALDASVYVADMDNYEILFANKFAKNIFGDIIGQKCYSVLQGKSAPCDFCTNNLLIDCDRKMNQPHVWEFQNLVTKRWYECHDQAIQWTNGKLVRFEMANDITVNKEIEQTLKENEISLRELNSTKDKFFSIIAHDLKNPFTVLKTGSELLKIYLEKNDLENSKAKAAMIENTTRHGYTLLENLLTWAKSQTGGIKFEPSRINLKNSVLKNILEVEDHANEKNIVIKNEISEDLFLTADINLLSEVFRNLITNAIKFTHPGGSITISAKTDNDFVEVAVIDTGIGIPKEHQDKLFRLDNNFSRVGTANEASTSLGLILCKEFIEKHKGKIWVESEENKGSEFRFTLPNIQLENS